MFGKIARRTFDGLIQWPDLMVFGLLTFALSFVMQLIFTPLWQMVTDSSLVLPSLLLLILQQIVLSAGSYAIVIAATRIIISRLGGEQMSLREGFNLRPYFRSTISYVVTYTLISSALIVGYLVMLLGPTGLEFASRMMTTGVVGLSQVPTDLNVSMACLAILVFFPLIIAWTVANLLISPVITVENIGGWQAIKRSWTLARRTIDVFIGLVVSALLIGFVVMLFTSYSTPDIGVAAPAPADLTQPQFAIFNVILSSILFVVGAIFNAAWYYEARIKIESADQSEFA